MVVEGERGMSERQLRKRKNVEVENSPPENSICPECRKEFSNMEGCVLAT